MRLQLIKYYFGYRIRVLYGKSTFLTSCLKIFQIFEHEKRLTVLKRETCLLSLCKITFDFGFLIEYTSRSNETFAEIMRTDFRLLRSHASYAPDYIMQSVYYNLPEAKNPP